MITFVKIMSWLTIVGSLGVLAIYGFLFVKNIDKYTGTETLVKLGIALFGFLGVLFKGIFGLQMAGAEVLSTGELWLLLVVVILPAQNSFMALFDFVMVICLAAKHPDKPTAIAIITAIFVALHGITLFIDKQMAKKGQPAVQEEK